MKLFAIMLAAAAPFLGESACANDCSGHGLCNVYSTCECYRNWIGNDCSRRNCYFGRAFVDTPQGDLNSNGVLDTTSVSSRATNMPTFEIFPLAYGDGATSGTSTWAEGHFYAECSNKGTCDRESGLCECWPGYEGSGCSRLACPTSTADTCSGHGTCHTLEDLATANTPYNAWDKSKTQQCKCDAGYTGIACDKRICPAGNDPITKYQRLTTVCMQLDASVSVAEHTANIPIDALATLKSDGAKLFGTKSGAYGTVADDPTVNGGLWQVFINGNVVDLAKTPGCVNLVDVVGEFTVGEMLVKNSGEHIVSAGDQQNLKIRTVQKETYTNTLQVNEQMVLKFVPYQDPTDYATPLATSTDFALTFTDEDGHSYTTRSIGKGMVDSDLTTVAELMADIEASLEELPNHVIGDVQLWAVTDATFNAGGDSDLANNGYNYNVACSGANPTFAVPTGYTGFSPSTTQCGYFEVKVEFTSNTGNIPQLEVYTGPNANFYRVEVDTLNEGTTENTLCSSRGTCDYTTGHCKCFQGFTGHDCARQNVLAMY